MRPTLSVGFDIVLEVDRESYELTRTGDGIGYSFRMDDGARNRIAGAVKEVLDRPGDVVEIEMQPGYVRVKVESDHPVQPKDLVDSLRQVPSVYNEYIDDPELEGLQFADQYIAAYRPDDAPDINRFIDRHTGSEDAPDSDGPVFEYDRSPPDVTGGDRHIAYEYVLPIDSEETYPAPSRSEGISFKWDDQALEALTVAVENTPVWPGSAPEEIARVAVFPEYVRVKHYSGALNQAPPALAGEVCLAISQFNRYKGMRPDRAPKGKTVPQPRLELKDSVYVGALSPEDGGADAWIAEKGLDDVTDEPREPETEDADDESKSNWDALNPFSDD